MPFRELMNDKVALVKQDGQRWDNITAVVNPDLIVIDDATLPVEEGDRFHRALPNGLTEVYLVLDRGFYKGLHDIPDHYQAKVRKETSLPRRQDIQATYNVSGPNARININSTDQSANFADLSQESLFDDMRRVVRDAVSDEVRREEILRACLALEEAKDTPHFMVKYREFIGVAADHLTVLLPFIPVLTQMLK